MIAVVNGCFNPVADCVATCPLFVSEAATEVVVTVPVAKPAAVNTSLATNSVNPSTDGIVPVVAADDAPPPPPPPPPPPALGAAAVEVVAGAAAEPELYPERVVVIVAVDEVEAATPVTVTSPVPLIATLPLAVAVPAQVKAAS